MLPTGQKPSDVFLGFFFERVALCIDLLGSFLPGGRLKMKKCLIFASSGVEVLIEVHQ